jgi:hypothetical protein
MKSDVDQVAPLFNMVANFRKIFGLHHSGVVFSEGFTVAVSLVILINLFGISDLRCDRGMAMWRLC